MCRGIFLAAVRIGTGESENGHSGPAGLRDAAASNLESSSHRLAAIAGHRAAITTSSSVGIERPDGEIAWSVPSRRGDSCSSPFQIAINQAAVARDDGAGALQLAIAKLAHALHIAGICTRGKVEFDYVARNHRGHRIGALSSSVSRSSAAQAPRIGQ